jgi:uncharacterized membrane protein YfhO
MCVIENFAATEKGICLAREAVTAEDSDGQRVRIRHLRRIDDFRCGSCRISSYEAERVELDVTAEKDCIFMFQDLYYPGWRAFVDGARQPILACASGIRALEITKGRHRVVMKYRPGSIRAGLGLTLLGIVLTVLYGSVRIRPRRP